jgi:hypothetical protein
MKDKMIQMMMAKKTCSAYEAQKEKEKKAKKMLGYKDHGKDK